MRVKIIFIAAIAMGLITTILFFNYMKKFDEVSVANVSLTDVVTAKQAIKKNQKLDASMLQVIQVPKMGLHTQTIKTIAEAEGKFADAEIEAGEVLLSHRIKSTKEEAQVVAKKVEEGYRAVSVGLNLVQSVSNLIEPEDVVDVIYTSPPDKITGVVTSNLLLEKIRVLAVGRRMQEVSADFPYVEYSSVTLEVKPQDTVNLINADEKGTISLVIYSRLVPQSIKK